MAFIHWIWLGLDENMEHLVSFNLFFNRFTDEVEMNVIIPNEHSVLRSRNKFRKKSYTGLKDISEALQTFDLEDVNEELEKFHEALLISIEVDGVFENLRQNELQKLNNKCRNKSIVILFSSKNQDKFSVYWKSEKGQNFLVFSPYNDTPAMADKNFYEFLASFLADSLANGHVGELNFIFLLMKIFVQVVVRTIKNESHMISKKLFQFI